MPAGKQHSPQSQLDQFRRLSDLFDPDPTKGASSPLSKLGASSADRDTIKSWSTPLNAAGITFIGEQKNLSQVEKQLYKEMQLDSKKASGHIGIGPEAMTGQDTSTIYHELIHHALSQFPQISFHDEEAAIRLIMIREGHEVGRNKAFLESTYVGGYESISKQLGPMIDKAEQQAREILKVRATNHMNKKR